jgi:hypothetical protein
VETQVVDLVQAAQVAVAQGQLVARIQELRAVLEELAQILMDQLILVHGYLQQALVLVEGLQVAAAVEVIALEILEALEELAEAVTVVQEIVRLIQVKDSLEL